MGFEFFIRSSITAISIENLEWPKDNLESTYAVFHHRAEMNSLACGGEYSSSLEI